MTAPAQDAAGLLSRCDAVLLDGADAPAAFGARLERISRAGFRSLLIHPGDLKAHRGIDDGPTPVSALVGWPCGLGTVTGKTVETLEAIQLGARGVEVMLNPRGVGHARFDLLEAEVSSLQKHGVLAELTFVVEPVLWTDWAAAARALKRFKGMGVARVRAGLGAAPLAEAADRVRRVREALGSGVQVFAGGDPRGTQELAHILDAGADAVSTPNPEAFLEALDR